MGEIVISAYGEQGVEVEQGTDRPPLTPKNHVSFFMSFWGFLEQKKIFPEIQKKRLASFFSKKNRGSSIK